jgi:hypothetical protein
VCVCHSVCRVYVFRENLYLHFLNFVCVRATVLQQGRYIAQKFESGWEVGVIKAFDKKGPHAGKFSVKYKDDPNWWMHSLMREGCGKDKHWVLLRFLRRDSA